MDTLDVRILRSILSSGPDFSADAGFRRSFSSIARGLRVDESTVANRVRRLRRSGFLRGWSVGINPHLVGQEMAQIWFDVNEPASKEDVIGKVCLLPGVAVVKDLYGPSVCVVLYYEGEATLRRTTELLLRLGGSRGSTSMVEPFPNCNLTISDEDLRIIRNLQKDPLISDVKLAKVLGRSARTVKRRIRRLLGGEAIYLVAELNPKFLTGGIVAGLLVSYDAPARKASAEPEVLAHLDDRLLFAHLDNPLQGYFAIFLTSIGKARETFREVLGIPGVRKGRLDLVQEVTSLYSVYEEQLERLRPRPRSRPSGGTSNRQT